MKTARNVSKKSSVRGITRHSGLNGERYLKKFYNDKNVGAFNQQIILFCDTADILF